MSSDHRLIGLESIAYGTARSSASGMPATLTTVRNIVPDSAVLAIAVPSETELNVEDSDYPDIVVHTGGEKVFEFATRDMDPNNFVAALGGGTNTGSTIWRAPRDAVVVSEAAIQAISKSYGGKQYKIKCVRTALTGGADLRFSKNESGTLSFRAKVLRPIALETDYPITGHIV